MHEGAVGRLHAGASATGINRSRCADGCEMGWRELENGDLLREAEAAGFELLIICDKNLRHQQNLQGRRLAILELWTNHRPPLEKHWSLIGRTAEAMPAGEYRAMESP